MEISDFPFSRLPALSRSACAELRRAARRLPLDAPEAAIAQLTSLLGAPLVFEPAPLEVCPPGALAACVSDPLVAVILETGVDLRAPRLAVEIDARLAACLVDRALGGEAGPSIVPPHHPLSDVACGVLGYVAARALGACAPAGALRVRAVITSPAALGQAVGDAGSLVWPARVTLGEDVGVVRAWIPDASLVPPLNEHRRVASTRLASLCVTLALEAGDASLRPDELASLGHGDVVVFERTRLRLENGAPAGTADVRAVGAARPQWEAALANGDARLAGRAQQGDARMTRDTTNSVPLHAALDLVGDAPIELRVELARVALTLSELAEMRPGEVLVTGRPLGTEVVLRAGDRAVATGELVDVEGELGVRVLRLGI